MPHRDTTAGCVILPRGCQGSRFSVSNQELATMEEGCSCHLTLIQIMEQSFSRRVYPARGLLGLCECKYEIDK